MASDSAICSRDCGLRVCDLGSSDHLWKGAGWACDSQIAAGWGPRRFESAAISRKFHSHSGVACNFGAVWSCRWRCDPNRQRFSAAGGRPLSRLILPPKLKGLTPLQSTRHAEVVCSGLQLQMWSRPELMNVSSQQQIMRWNSQGNHTSP